MTALIRTAVIAAGIASIVGCAVPLSPEAQKIRTISAQNKEKCEFVKLITATKNIGPDKAGNAMKVALNETAAVGGDSFYIASTAMHFLDGASIVGEAYRCRD